MSSSNPAMPGWLSDTTPRPARTKAASASATTQRVPLAHQSTLPRTASATEHREEDRALEGSRQEGARCQRERRHDERDLRGEPERVRPMGSSIREHRHPLAVRQ
jgi:hypothetical protein